MYLPQSPCDPYRGSVVELSRRVSDANLADKLFSYSPELTELARDLIVHDFGTWADHYVGEAYDYDFTIPSPVDYLYCDDVNQSDKVLREVQFSLPCVFDGVETGPMIVRCVYIHGGINATFMCPRRNLFVRNVKLSLDDVGLLVSVFTGVDLVQEDSL